ncbi:MAG: O-antigen ligase family protein [Oscillospiraceae bacterium]|jgi:putative inorganic carbon (HCO3(-)) transporter|nr:O-antigen ligase family protein [Oscillospiraceae bacterium]
MQKIIKSSLIYRAIAAVAAFFGRQWQKSALLGRFLGGAKSDGGGLFSAPWTGLWALIRRAFRALRLDTLLRGSLFTHPELWCALTLAAAPLIPTMAAVALVCVSFASLFLKLGTDAHLAPARHPAIRYILLFALLYAAAIFTSVTVRGSLKGGALQVLFTLFAVAVCSALREKKQLVWAIRAFAVSGLLVSCYGLLQYVRGAVGSAAWFDSEMFSGIGMRVFSTLGNPNVLAEYLLLVIPFTAAAALSAKKALARLFFLGCLAAMLLTMALTFARGGWLGLILAAAVFLVMLDRRFILLGLVGLVALYFLLPDVIITRLLSIGNLKDGSTSYRLSIWFGTLAMLRDFWLVGIGPGVAAFNKVYPIYGYGAIAAPHSHNLYLQIICDAGVFPLVVFVIFLFSYLRSLASAVAKSKDRELNYYRIAAVSAALGFLLQGATDYSFYNYRVALAFWGVTGLGMALSRISEKTEESK